MIEKTRRSVMHIRIETFGTEQQSDRTIAAAVETLRTARYNVELLDVDVDDDA